MRKRRKEKTSKYLLELPPFISNRLAEKTVEVILNETTKQLILGFYKLDTPTLTEIEMYNIRVWLNKNFIEKNGLKPLTEKSLFSIKSYEV